MVESCILTEWKVNVGDQVAEGDVLAVIETDKASLIWNQPPRVPYSLFFGKRMMMSRARQCCSHW